jgi:hypothetical protein
MKTATGLLLSTLLLVFTALLPSPARAQTPTDCSNGCYIITCNNQLCTLWRCNASGCHFINSWDRRLAEVAVSTDRADKAPAMAPEVAFVSVCAPGKPCDLYELTATEALRVASFDNAADLVRHRESLRLPPPRRR